jgi:uncharacterized phosphosugar-binding protein
MLHEGAALSSQAERVPGRARQILAGHPIAAGDVLIVASNSGGNAVVVELAELAQRCGAQVIAVTSLAHARAASARAGGRKLHEVADIVLDNLGRPGDAALDVGGVPFPVGPTSTVVGAAILQAVLAQAVAELVSLGADVQVWRSANVAGGDAANALLVESYRGDVTALVGKVEPQAPAIPVPIEP